MATYPFLILKWERVLSLSLFFYLPTKNKNEVLDRQAALRAIWGDDNYFNGRSMDVYIAKLRKILRQDESIEIMNVHGRGFKLIDHS